MSDICPHSWRIQRNPFSDGKPIPDENGEQPLQSAYEVADLDYSYSAVHLKNGGEDHQRILHPHLLLALRNCMVVGILINSVMLLADANDARVKIGGVLVPLTTHQNLRMSFLMRIRSQQQLGGGFVLAVGIAVPFDVRLS